MIGPAAGPHQQQVGTSAQRHSNSQSRATTRQRAAAEQAAAVYAASHVLNTQRDRDPEGGESSQAQIQMMAAKGSEGGKRSVVNQKTGGLGPSQILQQQQQPQQAKALRKNQNSLKMSTMQLRD